MRRCGPDLFHRRAVDVKFRALKDVGVGMLFASSRSSEVTMIHVDLAKPRALPRPLCTGTEAHLVHKDYITGPACSQALRPPLSGRGLLPGAQSKVRLAADSKTFFLKGLLLTLFVLASCPGANRGCQWRNSNELLTTLTLLIAIAAAASVGDK